MSNAFIFLMDILGTVAFAVSGALVAISGSLDLFGVVFVGCITAVGGGILRDVLMGRFPPDIFSATPVLALAVLTSIFVFVLSYCKRKSFDDFKKRLDVINNYFDAAGLAIFTVIGVEKAGEAGFGGHFVFVICMGLLTGVGGGVLRDILVDQTPSVLQKHIYAVASLVGAIVYFFGKLFFDRTVAILISVVLIVLMRLLATGFRWQLPKIDLDETKK